MVEHLIVPVDGSEESWSAFEIALALARSSNARIDIVQIVAHFGEVPDAERIMRERVSEHDTSGVTVDVGVELVGLGVAGKLTELTTAQPGSTIVMASHGRGRSAALIGSVTEEVLRTTFGPMIVVGPHAEVPDFTRPIIVTVDGTDLSESAVPLAAAWAIELGSSAWIVEVLDPGLVLPPDIAETIYTSRLAHRMQALSGHEVEHEVLRSHDPVEAVTEYATSKNASLIVAATHGRTGASRLALGSTASGFVRHATCPVLLVRPPHLPNETASEKHAQSLFG